MAEYKATPEQWANIEEWVGDKLSCYLSIRELRARVEALEVNTKQWRTDHLDDEPINWEPEARAARRPKLPSLKEQALAALHGIDDQGPTPEQVVTIRRALEVLPND